MDIETVKSAYAAFTRRAHWAPPYFHMLTSAEQDAWDEAVEEIVAPLQDELTAEEIRNSALANTVDNLEDEVTELERKLRESEATIETLSAQRFNQ